MAFLVSDCQFAITVSVMFAGAMGQTKVRCCFEVG